MTIELTNEQVKEMGILAILASHPVGMGHLHHNSNLTHEDISKVLKVTDSLHIDYFQGRMVKFSARRKYNTSEWEFADNINYDYQSWITKYSSYKELAEAAILAK